MPLDLTTRAGKGSPLTAIEADKNLTDIETLVNSIEADVSDEDVDDISTRLDAAEVDIDDAETDIAGHTADIADHETRVSANETHAALSSGNPHSVNKTNVGLGNVLNEQQVPASQWLQNGFVDIAESDITWDDATFTLTLEPSDVEFDYYFEGILQNDDATYESVLDDETDEGLYVFYLDYVDDVFELVNVLNPSESEVDDVIENKVVVAYVMWDGTDGRLMEERHGCKMSPATHHWIHDNIGAVYKDGMLPADFTIDDDGDDSLDAQFSLSAGEFYDEDIGIEIDAVAVGAGLEIWYLDSDVWKWTTQGTAPNAFSVLAAAGGDNRLAYNNSGAQTEVANADFVLCHVFATNITADTADGKGRFIAIQGQATYSTVTLARAGAETEINGLAFGTLPLPEIVPICTVIFQTSTAPSFDNAVKATTRSTGSGHSFIDWRQANLKGAGGTISDHGGLAGLTHPDHPQYVHEDAFTAADVVLVGTAAGVYTQITLAASEFFGKKAAGAAMNISKAEALTILNVEDGADVTDAVNIASSIVGVDAKATPVDADSIAIIDSEAANVLKETTWTQVKAFLKTYHDTLYHPLTTIGIADNNILLVDDADAADNDYAKFTANGLEGRSYAEVKQDLDLEIGTDVLAEQTIGIADDNLLEVDDADAADDDYAKFTANGLEGRSYAEVKADLSLEDADINALVVAQKLDDMATPDDNTDLDATTTEHGLLPKLNNTATDFLNGQGNWAEPAGGGSSQAPRGYIDGFQTRNDSDLNHDIEVGIGHCRNDANDGDIILDTVMTKRIDAAWSAGDNAGGMDTGSVAASDWYHIYVIYHPGSDLTDVLFTKTYGSPTMPAGYTKKRRIASVLTNSSSNIIRYWQAKEWFYWYDPPADYTLTTTTTASSITLSVPTGHKPNAFFNCYQAEGVYFSNLDGVLDEACGDYRFAPLSSATAYSHAGVNLVFVLVNSSSQIRARATGTKNTDIATLGWIDHREKDV